MLCFVFIASVWNISYKTLSNSNYNLIISHHFLLWTFCTRSVSTFVMKVNCTRVRESVEFVPDTSICCQTIKLLNGIQVYEILWSPIAQNMHCNEHSLLITAVFVGFISCIQVAENCCSKNEA